MKAIQHLNKATLLTAALLFSSQTFAADEQILIPEDVPFAKTLSVRDAVKNECKLGEKISAFTDKYAKNAKASEDLGNGKRLEMEITDVLGTGGGGWSGPKWVEVTGTLMDGNKEIASFRAKRFSTGGAFAAMKGTCAILGRCTKALGADIAKWLKNPVDGAELGDAR